jgi:hypothetical protein
MIGKLMRVLFLAAIVGGIVKVVRKVTGREEPEQETY